MNVGYAVGYGTGGTDVQDGASDPHSVFGPASAGE